MVVHTDIINHNLKRPIIIEKQGNVLLRQYCSTSNKFISHITVRINNFQTLFSVL